MRGQLGRAFAAGCALALVLIIAGISAAMAAELTFDLDVKGGRLPENMRLIRVAEGDVVTLRWTTDQPLLVHLHGYDIETRIVPGTVAALKFTAYATGRFPIHIHAQQEHPAVPMHEETPLADVEVYPR